MDGVSASGTAKPLVDEAITTTTLIRPGASVLFYRAVLPLSSGTLAYTAGIIHRHRKDIGSPWRKLTPGQQALLVLAYLRKGETFADLAAGFGVGTATAWRYVSETIVLLAARSPKLRRALARAKKARACLRGDRRHLNPHRPGRRGPAVLLRQTPPPRHEPAGHLRSRRRDPLGLRPAARRHP
jgi:hypothetical protein